MQCSAAQQLFCEHEDKGHTLSMAVEDFTVGCHRHFGSKLNL